MLEYTRLYVGQRQSLERLIRGLVQFEYRRVDQVADPGDLALHGGGVDLFPPTF